MKSRKKIIILALLFIVSIANYSNIAKNDEIRSVHFLSIFALGVISAILLREIVVAIKNR